MASDPISHSMTWVAGTRPLPIPRASAHSIRAAAAIVLGAGVQKLASLDTITTVALTAAARDLLGACGDAISVSVAAPMADETAVYFLAQLSVAGVAIVAGTRPLPGSHLGAVGIGRAAPMASSTWVHL